MHRRRLLGLLAAASLAGCSGEGTGTGPATTTTGPQTGRGTTAAARPRTEADTTRPPDDGPGASRAPLHERDHTTFGLSLSPVSYGSDDFTAFFDRATAAGSLVRAAGAWRDLANPEGGATAVAELADRFGYRPAV